MSTALLSLASIFIIKYLKDDWEAEEGRTRLSVGGEEEERGGGQSKEQDGEHEIEVQEHNQADQLDQEIE